MANLVDVHGADSVAKTLHRELCCLKPEELIKLPLSLTVSGPTGSGKSFFVGQLIENLRQAGWKIEVIIFYGTDQKLFEYMNPIETYQGLDAFQSVVERYQMLDTNNLPPIGSKEREYPFIIIDDLMNEAAASEDVCNVITRGISHQGLSIALIYQNMLPQKKAAQTIAHNVKYKAFFYNPQAAGQFRSVVSRMGSGKNTLMAMYNELQEINDGTSPPVALVVDCSKHRAWFGLEPEEITELKGLP